MAMKAKKAKAEKVMTPKDAIGKYRPSIHFASEEGLEAPDGDVGDDVKMTVHGKIASKSEHDHGDGPRKSMSVEIHKVSHDRGNKEGMVEDGTADGMKAAMDGVLSKKQGKKGGFKKPVQGE
jgi:hypothetical protein